MDEEVTGQEGNDEGTPAQEIDTTEQASASLSAGFNKVRGTTDEAAEIKAAEPGNEPPAEVELESDSNDAPEIEPLSQDELRAALAKLPELEQFKGLTAGELQKLHGKMGEFNRTLQNLQTSGKPANSAAHKAALQKLTDEYPELAETMAPLFEAAGSGPGVSTEQISEIVKQQVGQAQAETTKTIAELRAQMALTKAHPDWEDLPSTPAYAQWMKSRPAEFQQEFNNTWDTGFVAKGLTEFKKWRDTTYAKQQTKQARLAGAVTPTGVPSRTQGRLPDSAGLSAGFNRVRKAA